MTNEREEVIVLITPTVIRDPADARKLTDEYGSRFKALEPLRQAKAGSLIKVTHAVSRAGSPVRGS